MEEHRRLAMAAAFVILLTVWSSPAMAMAAAAATEKLKIAVPLKHGFRAFVNVTDQGVTGYCIDLFEAAVNKLPYRLIYEFVVFDRSYDELVQSVSSGINDAAVGDITIIAD
uniref:Solute-binding protein family 3/N-terminal domain-containing protein n=1 Tax=Oryza meridionalis TaxID=40149 RepID=A0A0E0DY66_9ORYZ